MFKRKLNVPGPSPSSGQIGIKHLNWIKISIAANISVVVIAVLFAAGSYVVHLSNTSPQFCATCHIMQPNVTSYLTSRNLDHVHQQAEVQCKDCHDYPLSAEIKSGINFITGNYAVDKSGNLEAAKFSDGMCTRCHISQQHVAQLTDFLDRNPHDNHNGELPCNTCHVSHGQQIDFCAQCHDNGGQRMIGQPIQSRGTLGGN
jgi:hypothetical protein